jgi:hypothetical protein
MVATDACEVREKRDTFSIDTSRKSELDPTNGENMYNDVHEAERNDRTKNGCSRACRHNRIIGPTKAWPASTMIRLPVTASFLVFFPECCHVTHALLMDEDDAFIIAGSFLTPFLAVVILALIIHLILSVFRTRQQAALQTGSDSTATLV